MAINNSLGQQTQAIQATQNRATNFLVSENGKLYLERTFKDEHDRVAFQSFFVSKFSKTPTLAACSLESVFSNMLEAYLTPCSNEYKFVYPYGDTATFIMSYLGLIELGYKTGYYKTITCAIVKKGEISYNPLTQKFILKPFTTDPSKFEERNKLPTIGALAFFELLTGATKAVFITCEEATEHGRRYSKAFNYLWKSDFEKMMQKTAVRKLFKGAPKTAALERALKNDMASVDEQGNPTYVDNPENKGGPKVDDDTNIGVEGDIVENVEVKETASQEPPQFDGL
ncbi:MAG: recombinase RecT [Clostridia bacterium]|jgi:phage RecT family recombinase|nr:recombinase RecT [Clostridia bacterium]